MFLILFRSREHWLGSCILETKKKSGRKRAQHNNPFVTPPTRRNLQELYVAFNAIKECSALTMLEHLEILDLEGCVPV